MLLEKVQRKILRQHSSFIYDKMIKAKAFALLIAVPKYQKAENEFNIEVGMFKHGRWKVHF